MWGRKRQPAEAARASEPRPERLKDALRKARVDQAERNAVVVDLHDAEVARLELLDEALDPLFEEIPKEVDLFDRGISRGETPRLWIDAIAHVAMGRDKRIYRFLQDTRYGRKVLAEIRQHPRDRRGGDEISGAAPDRARAGARRRLAARHRRPQAGGAAGAPPSPTARRQGVSCSACSRAARS